jgi:hypothetical protein
MNGVKMRINELLLESADELKHILVYTDHNLVKLADGASKIKSQYLTNPTPQNKEGMVAFLGRINMELFQMANLPQWERWIETEDGQEVMTEINSLYYDNEDFIKKHR